MVQPGLKTKEEKRKGGVAAYAPILIIAVFFLVFFVYAACPDDQIYICMYAKETAYV